jgi:hypothetical protein
MDSTAVTLKPEGLSSWCLAVPTQERDARPGTAARGAQLLGRTCRTPSGTPALACADA